MAEHLTVGSCGGLRSEHKCSGLKVLIFTSPVSCLSSIFLSPGLLRLYQLELTEHDIIYSRPSENTAEWLGEATSVNGTGGSLWCCTQGPSPGRIFPNYWNCMNSNDPWSSSVWKLVGCFQYFHFHYLLSSRELPGESSRNNSMWSGYS